MIQILMILFSIVNFSLTLPRIKRDAYQLPDGVEAYLPSIKPKFSCTSSGYFADIDNNCQLFHVCVPQELPGGKKKMEQYTFACGNQTIFSQFTLTCTNESDAVPCSAAKSFFYLNERIGNNKELLHNDEDLEKLSSILSEQN